MNDYGRREIIAFFNLKGYKSVFKLRKKNGMLNPKIIKIKNNLSISNGEPNF
jgi:hypothetical protein